MARKQIIEAQFKEAQRQYAAGELPLPDQDDPTVDWPLDKFCVYLFNTSDGGPELVEVFLECGEFCYEPLADAAVELERRHFPHVAEILRRVAKSAKSQVDNIIACKIEPHHRDPNGRRQWHLTNWLYGRIKVTGQSWNELVRFYGLKDSGWMGFKDPDLICDDGRRWREIRVTNGAECVH